MSLLLIEGAKEAAKIYCYWFAMTQIPRSHGSVICMVEDTKTKTEKKAEDGVESKAGTSHVFQVLV